MQTFTTGSAIENEPEKNLADSFNHQPNEPATRNDLRILATLIDRRFAKVDARFDRIDLQFRMMQTMFKEEMLEFRESMRKEMSRFAGFLAVSGISALGIFAAFAR
jgi:hypothetical protein